MKRIKRVTALMLCLGGLVAASEAAANARDQAQRMHNRLTGTPATDALLTTMASLIDAGQTREAALLATEQDGFYNVVLKNFATPWTNRERDVFAPLNDYTATVIGLVRDDRDFREVLFADLVYTGDQGELSALGHNDIPAPSGTSNAHFEAMEAAHVPLQQVLTARAQSALYGLPADATAGIMTSRAAAKAFFYAGTNRAMLRFTLMNHLCHDLEQLKDATRPADRIRQDITRSPGGDSRIFLNNCIACHSGMDPMAGAFAYYNWSGPEGSPAGEILYNRDGQTDPATGTRVQAKYRINANNFIHGFETGDDTWLNYWRDGQNAVLGWDGSLPGHGQGAKSLGQELAHSEAFATCQAEKTFRTVCLRSPASTADLSQVEDMRAAFSANGHRLRDLFVDAAVYCMGD
ncbi:hypothetical protein S7S_15240 [Isoalcanivorax pacificus W11-5]|uniref:Uncharacterized protein n=1 Tax=Isoalcanivorax pacificus W11-5 TaxID=391936 RepID=A0A0B4XRT5_9GAMM|nr:hypothetical protein [Isoalcanivorax pacificus]AJD49460.1 hypothetical protein S7S_15240 [Isoalcanivorax pacificus W11-5]